MPALSQNGLDRQWVVLDDGQVIAAYAAIANPAAPWVVFSNSLVTDRTIWDAQAEALSRRWNVLRYDQRGHGNSALPREPVNFRRLGADVVALLDHFEIERAAFVGLSMGVPTGLSSVSLAPTRFSGLMLADGQAKTAPGGGQQWRDRITFVRERGLPEFARSTAARWLADSDSFRLARLEAMIAAAPVEGFVACAEALADFDVTGGLEAIGCPVLLVAGEMDGKLPETMRVIADRIPNARFKTIPDAGHVPCYERPEAFNAAMLAFLESLN
jgi:3-oxoadipate enol-lactonase